MFSGNTSAGDPWLRDDELNVEGKRSCLMLEHLAGSHLHDDFDYLWLGEKRTETEVSRSLLEIVETNIYGALQ